MSEPATKSDLVELRKQFNEDMKIQMRLLYEKFSSDVRLLSEQSSAINKRLTVVETKADVIIEAIADLKVESTSHRDHARRLERLISALETR